MTKGKIVLRILTRTNGWRLTLIHPSRYNLETSHEVKGTATALTTADKLLVCGLVSAGLKKLKNKDEFAWIAVQKFVIEYLHHNEVEEFLRKAGDSTRRTEKQLLDRIYFLRRKAVAFLDDQFSRNGVYEMLNLTAAVRYCDEAAEYHAAKKKGGRSPET